MIPPSAEVFVVTPVYEDIEAASVLFEELSKEVGRGLFVIAVDDGSVRNPLLSAHLKDKGIDGVLIRLKRNVGHQRAIAVGLGFIDEHIEENHKVIVMDSDGEDLPSQIPTLLAKLDDLGIDIVVAHRKSRVETLRFKIFYAIYKIFFGLMTGRKISFGNFMALKPKAVRRLVAMQELPIHIAGTVLASKLRTDSCLLDRGARYAGYSKMNFVGLVLHGFKGLMIFAEDVLVRVGIACAVIASLTIILSIIATILKMVGFATPGWFSVALGILILMFLQTGAITLMSLLLTGVVKGGAIAHSSSYKEFILNCTFVNHETDSYI